MHERLTYYIEHNLRINCETHTQLVYKWQLITCLHKQL